MCRLPAANGREKASLKLLSESKHVVSNLTVCASDSYFELTQRLLVGSKNLPERHLADKVYDITNMRTGLVKRGLIQCKLREVSSNFRSSISSVLSIAAMSQEGGHLLLGHP